MLSECENEDPECFYRGHFSNGPHALNGSITYVYRSILAVIFTYLCYVIWEFFSHTVVM